MKRILITGGNGYIGHNLKKYLIENGCHISICDKYGWRREAEKLTLDDIRGHDGVVHLAALSGILACRRDPDKAITDNILTAQNVFRKTKELGIPCVFTSSQAAKKPDSSAYAFIKRTCECMAYGPLERNDNVFLLRLTNVYGGEYYLDKKDTVVKMFIVQYRNGNPLQIHGDGSQTRDFIHVEDVCRAIHSCFEYWDEERDNLGAPVDIGTGVATSIADLAHMFPEDAMAEFIESRSVGESSNIAYTDRAEDFLGFVAENRLPDYIKEMV